MAESGGEIEEEVDELCPHFNDTIIMSEAGHRLKLKEVAIASGMKLYHSFREHCDPADNHDYQLAAMACLSLATKIHEVHCRLSDVVNTYYRCLHPDEPILDVGPPYWRLKESLAKYELLVLRVINFDLNHDLPHKYLLHFLLSLSLWVDHSHLSGLHIYSLSWTFLQDSFHTTLNKTHKPIIMAAAVLYLAIRCCKARIPKEGTSKKWWEVLCPSVTEKELMDISTSLMDFYDKKNTTKLENIFDKELEYIENMENKRKEKDPNVDKEEYLI